MKNKNFIISTLSAILILVIIPAVTVFIIDPIQIYHDQISLSGKVKYFKEARHQNAGLISKFLERDFGKYTIIMGTSMSENFTSSKFDKTLADGTKTIKFSMAGSSPEEQFFMMDKILSKNKTTKVFFDLHWYFWNEPKLNQKVFPYDLYEDNALIKGKYYLFNHDYFYSSLQILLNFTKAPQWTENLDKLYSWYDLDINKFKRYQTKDNLTKLNREIKKIVLDSNEIIIAKNYQYPLIDKYIVSLVKKYPNVEFNIFFPPYSTKYYRSSNDKYIKKSLVARKYVVDSTKNFSNVNIFGFDNEYDIVNNIYNYKDYGHYRAYINDLMMKKMIKKENLLTLENIDEYLTKMVENINSYNTVYYKDLKIKE